MGRKRSGAFRFKRFAVEHDNSAIKVGVDGVLVALLAPADGVRRILDAGCGCGVISLVMAQRTEESGAEIVGIDIDTPSVEEAASNFAASPWSGRLSAIPADFGGVCASAPGPDGRYDLIVSNPPFFRSGGDPGESARMQARHMGGLSPFSLIEGAGTLLNPGGRLTLVAPAEFEDEMLAHAAGCGLVTESLVRVRGHAAAPVKRVVVTWRLAEGGSGSCTAECGASLLTLEEAPGTPTPEYRRLGSGFYLRF